MVKRKLYFAQPTVRDVRPVDPVTTALSIGFKNSRFLWDQIAPVATVDEKSATFFSYDRDFWFKRQEGAERAAEGPYTRVGYEVSTDNYNCIEYGFEKPLGDVTAAASQTPESLAAQDVSFLTNLIQLELEKLAAAEFFVTGQWGTSNTLAGGNQWSDFASSDPIADIDVARRTVKRNTGGDINSMFVGLLGWEKLKEHPLILDKYKHTQVGIMTPALVASVLDIPELIVGDTVENTAQEGASFVGADIWADNALLLVKNAPALGVANGAYMYIWDERGNVPWAMETYREEGSRSEVSRVFTHADPKIVSAQHGYLFLDLVA